MLRQMINFAHSFDIRYFIFCNSKNIIRGNLIIFAKIKIILFTQNYANLIRSLDLVLHEPYLYFVPN